MKNIKNPVMYRSIQNKHEKPCLYRSTHNEHEKPMDV